MLAFIIAHQVRLNNNNNENIISLQHKG